MASTTDTLMLIKPELEDNLDPTIFADNFDIIDRAIKENTGGIEKLKKSTDTFTGTTFQSIADKTSLVKGYSGYIGRMGRIVMGTLSFEMATADYHGGLSLFAIKDNLYKPKYYGFTFWAINLNEHRSNTTGVSTPSSLPLKFDTNGLVYIGKHPQNKIQDWFSVSFFYFVDES